MHHRSLIIFLSCILSLVTVEIAAGNMFPPTPGFGPAMPSLGQDPALFGQGQGPAMMPPGQGHTPTPAEMEAMQKEMEQFFASLSPEDIKELENMGRKAINDDPDGMAKALGISKDELLKIANEGAAETQPTQPPSALPDEFQEGDEEEEPSHGFPQPPQKPVVKEEEEEPTGTVIATPAEKNALHAAIEGLLLNLESLQNKAAVSSIIHQELRSYEEEIRDLIFYLSLLNKEEHTDRLAGQQNSPLLKALMPLHEELATKEPLIPQPAPRMYDTPYDHLTVAFTATDKEIDKQYNKLAKRFKKAAVLKKLAPDASATDKKRALKIAADSLELLTDDYNQLKDPQLRAIVDAQVRAEEEQFREEATVTKNQVVAVIQAISAAIYQQKILELLNAFLSEYEPLELQKRKEFERAEKSQLDEQKKRYKRKGSKTPGSNFEPTLFTPGVTGPVPSYEGGPAGGYYGDTGISPSRMGGWDKLFNPESSSPLSSPTPTTPTKVEDKDKDKKEYTTTTPSEAHQKALKVDQRSPEQLIKDITQQFEKLNKEVTDEKTTKLFKQLETTKSALLKDVQGQEKPADQSKEGVTNGNEKKPSEESSEKDSEESSTKKSDVQKLRSKKDGEESGQEDSEKGGQKDGSKKDGGKKSSRKESLKKSTEQLVKDVVTWQKTTLGLDKLSNDLKKLVEKKRYEPQVTDKEAIAATELFARYEEAQPVPETKAAPEQEETEGPEKTIPPAMQTLKETFLPLVENWPGPSGKKLKARANIITALVKKMEDLRRFYLERPIEVPIEKKEERKKPSAPLRQ